MRNNLCIYSIQQSIYWFKSKTLNIDSILIHVSFTDYRMRNKQRIATFFTSIFTLLVVDQIIFELINLLPAETSNNFSKPKKNVKD